MHLFEEANTLMAKFGVSGESEKEFHQAVRSAKGAAYIAVQEKIPDWASEQNLPSHILALYVSEDKVELSQRQVEELCERTLELLSEEVEDTVECQNFADRVLGTFNGLPDEQKNELIIGRVKDAVKMLGRFPDMEM